MKTLPHSSHIPIKIAILSDIHGNLPALKTVAADVESWQPHLVIVNGDIVNRGPLSRHCLEFVQQKQETDHWQVLRGNHEDYILECARPDSPRSGPQYEIMRFAHWCYAQLNGHTAYLADLPEQFTYTAPDGSQLRATHASMRNNRDGIFLESDDDELRAQITPAPAVFATAHTHQALIRRVDQSLVVNVGSVGAPFDEDPRAGYGRFTWTPTSGWNAEIVRLAYDRAQTEQDFVTSGFLTEAGPLNQLMLIELRRSRGLVFRWATRYQEAVLNGSISIEDSVQQLLADEDLRPFLGPPGWKYSQ